MARTAHAPPRPTIIVDFDGTITKRDTLELVVDRFGDAEVRREVEVDLGGTLTLEEVIARQYGTLSKPLEEVSAWLIAHSELRPGFHDFVRLTEERAWPLRIVSSGVRELIEPLLAREGLSHLALTANSLVGDPPPWVVAFKSETPCAICGEVCKRRTATQLAAGSPIVYVGDGFSDGCAAEVAERVFARRRLATYLEERGLEFEPFSDFSQLVERLAVPRRARRRSA
jgi:2,3-diketo-5-methylthio-1-phosphopentane phosphatase